MSKQQEELLRVANRLDELATRAMAPELIDPIESIEKTCKEIHRAWSGSWFGYHAYVYYEGLTPPPPGAHFTAEWGLMDTYGSSHGSRGDWEEQDPKQLKDTIYKLAGSPDLKPVRGFFKSAEAEFDQQKAEALSILSAELDDTPDTYLANLKAEIEHQEIISPQEGIRRSMPQGPVMSRDTKALTQGFWTPPHYAVLSDAWAHRSIIEACNTLASAARKAGSHLARKQKQLRKSEMIGTNVFIGHGKSLLWKDLKDFVQDRVKLPWDEFNRVPVAGVANTVRLAEMLDAAAIAFLVMTAEDEQADGSFQARMNVIHEAGLFQGRLGFSRAIILLEDGCKEFSNIQGLGQIRFPNGNIKAVFEEIRQVLEREHLI